MGSFFGIITELVGGGEFEQPYPYYPYYPYYHSSELFDVGNSIYLLCCICCLSGMSSVCMKEALALVTKSVPCSMNGLFFWWPFCGSSDYLVPSL